MNRIIGLVNYHGEKNNYTRWLTSADPEIEFIMLNHKYQNANELLKCKGLVLTGGEDINPVRYGEDNSQNLSQGIDDERDSFEFELIEIAHKNQLPTLGICKGLQVLNVFFGGSLYQHIDNHRKPAGAIEDITHTIKLTDNSLLYQFTNTLIGTVNSAHHQAPKKIGNGLIPTAFAEDGIIEAIELENKNYPFLGVQWQPERMKDRNENKFSYEILKWFINNTN